MQEANFDAWLANDYVGRKSQGLDKRERAQLLWLARRIEQHEGDLDTHFDSDRMAGLLARLMYARRDALRGQPPQHAIPVGQNAYGMTSNLRHTATLYRRFRDNAADLIPRDRREVPKVRARTTGKRDWPLWEQPSDADLVALARTLAPLVRFLHPEIVRAVVEDNERHRAEWEAALHSRGVDPSRHLWERSATVFPGVRRYTGGAEIARFRQGRRGDGAHVEHALLLDDNHYPKQVWSFALRGRPFQNLGPEGYQLAHLVDHKAYKHHWAEELVGPISELVGQAGLPGLFTSVANTVYVPAVFLRPTDFSPLLRNLLQRRATDLYGSFCQLLPAGLTIREPPSTAWATSAFTWAEPVGTTEHLAAFLAFRSSQLEELLLQRVPQAHPEGDATSGCTSNG